MNDNRLVFLHYTGAAFKINTRNAWKSLAYSPLGAAVSPIASSSEKWPCYHLANVDKQT